MQTDEQLFEQWCHGDKSAGRMLFRRHYNSIDRFFRNKVGVECQDLTQATFMACHDSRLRFAGRSRFRTWLFSIARYTLLSHLQAKHHRPRDCTFEESMAELAPRGFEPTDVQPQTRLLLRALRRLPLPVQMTLELHYWEKLSTPEIAEVLDVPLGTVTSRLKRGRERLHQLIYQLGSSAEESKKTIRGFDRWVSEVRAQVPPRAPISPDRI